jgi:hypothetical protein
MENTSKDIVKKVRLNKEELERLTLKELKLRHPEIKVKKKADFIDAILAMENEEISEGEFNPIKELGKPLTEKQLDSQKQLDEDMKKIKEEKPVKEVIAKGEPTSEDVAKALGDALRSNEHKKAEYVNILKNRRATLDMIAKLAEARDVVGDEVADAVFLGRAWLGKLLGDLGQKTPYSEDEIHQVHVPQDIPPTADLIEDDVFHEIKQRFMLMNDVEAVVSLRYRIKDTMDRIASGEKFISGPKGISYWFAIAELTKARFYLGRILSKLRR